MEVEAICLQELSDELLVQVFARIGHPPKLASCTRLSKRFHAVLSDDGVWRDIVVQAVLGKQPPRNGVPLGLSGPDDSYRHAYVRLMYDVSRLEILRDELVNSSWRFYFQADMYLFHCSPEQAAQRAGATGNQGHLATFLDNGLFTSNIAGAPSQRTPTRWQLLACAELESDCPSAASSPDLRWGEDAAAHKRLDVIDDNDGDDEALTSDTAGADSSLDSQREVCATAAERRLEVGEEEGGGEIGEDDAAVASAAADIPASRVRGPLSPAGAPLANLMSPPAAPLANPLTSPSRSTLAAPQMAMGAASRSPLAHPLRSPSGDFTLLASADSGSYVQVGSYPVLKVSRTQNWGWCLTNKFVTIISANTS